MRHIEIERERENQILMKGQMPFFFSFCLTQISEIKDNKNNKKK